MFLILVIPVLAAGFILCHSNPYYSFKLHRYEGQYLYLKSANLGFVCFLVILYISFLLNEHIPPNKELFGYIIPLDIFSYVKGLIASALPILDDADLIQLSWVTLLSVGTLSLAYVWSYMGRLHSWLRVRNSNLSKLLLMRDVLSDSPLDKLFFDSFVSSRPLLISMDSRKVYVGNVISLGEPNESEGMDQEITIVPIMSGYRNKDTLEVKFTTDYNTVDSDLIVVLKQELITSATWFEFDVYEALNGKNKRTKDRLTNSFRW